MFEIAAIAIFISMLLVLIRLIKGPTLYDRVLAGNAFGTHTVLLIGVVGFLTGRPDFLDIALLVRLPTRVHCLRQIRCSDRRWDLSEWT